MSGIVQAQKNEICFQRYVIVDFDNSDVDMLESPAKAVKLAMP
jgi:hypothetical protein